MSPKRVPPSAEQVAEALRRRVPDATTRAIPLDEATMHVRIEFRTTPAFAGDWIEQAALDEGNFLVRTRSGESGRIHGALTRNAGRHHYPKIDAAFLLTAFTERGFLAPPLDDFDAPIVRYDGQFIPADKRQHPIKRTGTPHVIDGLPFVVLPEALVHMAERMREERLAESTVREAERHIESAEVHAEQGAAVAYLRGLLKAAEVRMYADLTTHMTGRIGGDREVAMSIHLRGPDIDRVADLLRRLGVEPTEGEYRRA